jgi:predicted lipid-binding transport protein (Tim44 family)
MRMVLVAALITGSLVSFEARAQERAGDAALGAVSGAVVLGPVGAVAGALIGFTAGPSIARSWGVRRSASRARVQRTSQTSAAPEPQATGNIASPPPAKPSQPPAGAKPPPVQGLE